MLLLATGNPAKAREMGEVLRGIPFRITSLERHPEVTLPEEGETSYRDNALAKARAAARATGLLALADDSGLEVDALGGRPGVLSARLGGPGLDDAARCRALLAALAGVPAERRTARFRCVIALADPDGRETTAEGVVEGRILDAPRGRGGFGYDPLFHYSPLGATFGELSAEAKSRVSHRARALVQAAALLRAWPP